jgi:aspartyl-tRNA(Asn)/glutamyl-tRNA(Gln) amidotransferase subunit C
MNIEDLKETAALAHLNLEEGELVAAFPAFEQMLGFFAAMQAADGDRAAFPVAALSGGSAGDSAGPEGSAPVESGFFRADSDLSHSAPRASQDNLLNNAGERDGRFIVVPNVL